MASSFILQCRENFFKGITPSGEKSSSTLEYKKIVEFAKEYFDANKYNEFGAAFYEGQYLISLWAAHMLLEYGQPDDELILASLDTIKSYSTNQLIPSIAVEEQKWINENVEKYKKYF